MQFTKLHFDLTFAFGKSFANRGEIDQQKIWVFLLVDLTLFQMSGTGPIFANAMLNIALARTGSISRWLLEKSFPY